MNRAPAGMSEPDYWPSAKVTVHEDEVRFGVHRVTAELYAPGLPPGTYDLYLPATRPAVVPEPEPAYFEYMAGGVFACLVDGRNVEAVRAFVASLDRADTPAMREPAPSAPSEEKK